MIRLLFFHNAVICVVFCVGAAGAGNNGLGTSEAAVHTRTESEKGWFELGRPRLGLEAMDKETVPVPWLPAQGRAPRHTVRR